MERVWKPADMAWQLNGFPISTDSPSVQHAISWYIIRAAGTIGVGECEDMDAMAKFVFPNCLSKTGKRMTGSVAYLGVPDIEVLEATAAIHI
jgi:hypothetical protein